ncbi:hypothetical protein E2C01_064138 [Portunus trituberculatus]|uniref:Uncharacterized protein n=1 Tax=Portunus trituberculatus TaxID=210409 RepID=A0A5B7HK13_PORTR|nr:hypothetical protein [Portunus trituberculatus]
MARTVTNNSLIHGVPDRVRSIYKRLGGSDEAPSVMVFMQTAGRGISVNGSSREAAPSGRPFQSTPITPFIRCTSLPPYLPPALLPSRLNLNVSLTPPTTHPIKVAALPPLIPPHSPSSPDPSMQHTTLRRHSPPNIEAVDGRPFQSITNKTHIKWKLI